jgi:hypothetical protein
MYTGYVLLRVNGYRHIASRANRPGRLPPRYTCAALDNVDAWIRDLQPDSESRKH